MTLNRNEFDIDIDLESDEEDIVDTSTNVQGRASSSTSTSTHSSRTESNLRDFESILAPTDSLTEDEQWESLGASARLVVATRPYLTSDELVAFSTTLNKLASRVQIATVVSLFNIYQNPLITQTDIELASSYHGSAKSNLGNLKPGTRGKLILCQSNLLYVIHKNLDLFNKFKTDGKVFSFTVSNRPFSTLFKITGSGYVCESVENFNNDLKQIASSWTFAGTYEESPIFYLHECLGFVKPTNTSTKSSIRQVVLRRDSTWYNNFGTILKLGNLSNFAPGCLSSCITTNSFNQLLQLLQIPARDQVFMGEYLLFYMIAVAQNRVQCSPLLDPWKREIQQALKSRITQFGIRINAETFAELKTEVQKVSEHVVNIFKNINCTFNDSSVSLIEQIIFAILVIKNNAMHIADHSVNLVPYSVIKEDGRQMYTKMIEAAKKNGARLTSYSEMICFVIDCHTFIAAQCKHNLSASAIHQTFIPPAFDGSAPASFYLIFDSLLHQSPRFDQIRIDSGIRDILSSVDFYQSPEFRDKSRMINNKTRSEGEVLPFTEPGWTQVVRSDKAPARYLLAVNKHSQMQIKDIVASLDMVTNFRGFVLTILMPFKKLGKSANFIFVENEASTTPFSISRVGSFEIRPYDRFCALDLTIVPHSVIDRKSLQARKVDMLKKIAKIVVMPYNFYLQNIMLGTGTFVASQHAVEALKIAVRHSDKSNEAPDADFSALLLEAYDETMNDKMNVVSTDPAGKSNVRTSTSGVPEVVQPSKKPRQEVPGGQSTPVAN